MKILDIIAFVLVVIGAINWMIFGVMDVNIVGMLFGNFALLPKFLYFSIGMSGLYMLSHYKDMTHEN